MNFYIGLQQGLIEIICVLYGIGFVLRKVFNNIFDEIDDGVDDGGIDIGGCR